MGIKIEKFEALIIWNKAAEMAFKIYAKFDIRCNKTIITILFQPIYSYPLFPSYPSHPFNHLKP